MSSVFFFIAASGVIAGAVGVVMLRDPFFSVLALVVHLVSLAALFLLLRAQFVAAVQVVVYAGAVMVLYVFVVAYVGGEADAIGERLRGSSDGSRRRAGGLGPARLRRRARRGGAGRAADRAARHGPGGDQPRRAPFSTRRRRSRTPSGPPPTSATCC